MKAMLSGELDVEGSLILLVVKLSCGCVEYSFSLPTLLDSEAIGSCLTSDTYD